MFNLFPKKKSVDEIIEDSNLQPLSFTQASIPVPDDNSKKDTYIKNLREQQEFLYKENEELKKILENIEEDGTYEHNKAVKLRQENVELRCKLDEFVKEVLNLRHLKEENIELMEGLKRLTGDQIKKEGSTYGITFNEAKTQIIQNDYTKCARERDEFKHQLNAANKEIEVLKRWKEEQLVVMKQWDEVDQYVRNHKDTKLGEFIAGTCLHFLKQRDEYKAEVEKLKEDIVDYVIEKDDKIQELEKKVETIYVCSRCGYKAAHTYYGGCGFCKEGQMMKVYEEQKHPMYPLHWGGIDPDILDQAQKQSIEEVVESLKGRKTQGFEDYDPSDFETTEDLVKRAKELTKDVDVDLDKPLDDQCDKEVKFNSEELLKRATDYADELNKTKTFIPWVEEPIDWTSSEGVPNDWKDVETTAENLEEKFDKGEDILDYFEKPWKCPCNKCKEAKAERTWEQAASDLALRLTRKEDDFIKLESELKKLQAKVTELSLIEVQKYPNGYEYFKKHGYWPWSWTEENKLDTPKECDNL